MMCCYRDINSIINMGCITRKSPLSILKENQKHNNGPIWDYSFQIEMIIEVCSKYLIRASGQVLLMKIG